MAWKKGQSGNPAGRQTGIRLKITDNFLRALSRDFTVHGEKVIAKVREESPERYLMIVAALLPKQSEHKEESHSEHVHHHDGNVAVSHTDALIEGIITDGAQRALKKPVPN